MVAVLHQPTLFGRPSPAPRLGPGLRHPLDPLSWIDVHADWLTDADDLFTDLLHGTAWTQPEVVMYERLLRQPRLSSFHDLDEPGLHPRLVELGAALGARYNTPIRRVGLNLYRTGDDAVAWHADRIGRVAPHPLVAVLTLGEPRRFLVRPMGGGASTRFVPAGGDLLVMGGACQHDWEHCVPRSPTPRARISVSWRSEVEVEVEVERAR